jgi:hypothetical protein
MIWYAVEVNSMQQIFWRTVVLIDEALDNINCTNKIPAKNEETCYIVYIMHVLHRAVSTGLVLKK